MRALREVGFGKVLRFFGYTFFEIAFDLVLFSPFKVMLLKMMGAKIGPGTVINRVCFLNLYRTGPKGLVIGENCFLGNEVLLDLASGITLGDHVTLAERVTVLSHMNVGYKEHPLQKEFPPYEKVTKLDSGCFVGVNSTIVGGIEIGREVFIAAGSVVTKNLPNRVLAGGVPAKILKSLDVE